MSKKRKWQDIPQSSDLVKKNDINIDSKRSFVEKLSKNNYYNTSSKRNHVESYEPSGINVLEFAEAQAYEMKNLKSTLIEANFSQNARFFQQLPKHMRRRAASHDVKRVPKRIRSKITLDEKSENKKTRKQKRKQKCLVEEYNRRKQKYKWLETHIWHSKRFRMKELWGYKIPEKSFSKGFRAIYRATTKSCSIQDNSYMEIIEVCGKEEDIIAKLKLLTTTDLILTSSQTSHYTETVLYHRQCYPNNAIGPVKMLWTSCDLKELVKLIIITHPSISEVIIAELHELFDVNPIVDVKSEGEIKQGYVKKHCLDFTMFSLTGPLSTSILNKVLLSHSNTILKSNHETCNSLLKNETIESRRIYNLCVHDPRLYLPSKKENPFKCFLHHEDLKSSDEKQVNIACSELWDNAQRKIVSESKMTDQCINEIKRKILLPGQEQLLNTASIPVVVLNSSIVKDDKLQNDVWNIILPSNWAMPFWIALVYQGARVGGQDDQQSTCFENSLLSFPLNYPDTSAGVMFANDISVKNENKHKRFPPCKKRNFDILGITHPFSIPWQELIVQWNFNIRSLLPSHQMEEIKSKTFYVLRDVHILNILTMYINKKFEQQDEQELLQVMCTLHDALIPIKIFSDKRSSPEDNATLCLPTSEDIEQLHNHDNLTLYMGPIEPAHKGLQQKFPFVYKKHDVFRHNVRYIGTNSRWLVGYVQNGRYSFANGKGAGIGFLSMMALFYMFKTCQKKDTFLFRNTNSLQYHFCKFDILI